MPNSKKGNSGIGLAEAQEMMKGKTPQTVIVAIADAGVDINHEDLKNMLWINADEVADNGIDDDNNGYIDDIYGWNFIGETTHDNLEITRQYALLNAKYELKATDDIENQDEYNMYLTIKQEFLQKNSDAKLYYERFLQIKQGMEFLEDSYGTDMTAEEVTNHKSKSKYEEIARGILARTAEASKNFDYLNIKTQLMSAYDHYDASYNYNYNPEFDPRRELVGDDYSNAREIGYGNNKVYYGEHSSHGTHVAGIVAADASNDLGAKGICQSCDIMSIRNVPDGDERDKDVANGIRYAV
ncbi:MAG: subtilisin family serine protease, partial [Bacteroidia bacterium]